MSDKWNTMKDAAQDAVTKTLDNNFDVIKTAKELNDKYSNNDKNNK